MPAGGEIPSTAFSFCLAFSFVPAKGKRKSANAFIQAIVLYPVGASHRAPAQNDILLPTIVLQAFDIANVKYIYNIY